MQTDYSNAIATTINSDGTVTLTMANVADAKELLLEGAGTALAGRQRCQEAGNVDMATYYNDTRQRRLAAWIALGSDKSK